MKRFHVHVAVDDLAASVNFYASVFGTAPTVLKYDYAKRMLDDPRVNFAISRRGAKPGLDHLGIQVDADDELADLRRQIAAAEIAAFDQPDAKCCYARSDKYWITDPQGIAWETFRSLEDVPVVGADSSQQACCEPPVRNTLSLKVESKSCC